MNQPITTLQRRLRLLLPLVLAAFASLAASAATVSVTVDDIKYTIDTTTGEATVASQSNSLTKKDLVIPDFITYNGANYPVTTIDLHAFNSCHYLTGSLTIGNSVTTIGANAFSYCSGLTGSLTIPNSVTSIDNEAFQGCTGLMDIYLPASLESIGNNTFNFDAKSVTCEAATPPTTSRHLESFNYKTRQSAPLIVPTESLAAYKTAREWKNFKYIRGDQVEPSAISLDKTTASINVGESLLLTATVTPEDATDKSVTWSSANPAIATVANGTVKGIAPGTVTITATTTNGLTATCKVTVRNPDPFTYSYNNTDMTATITGLASWVTELHNPELPASVTHNGQVYVVTTIGLYAFKDRPELKGTLSISNSIIYISAEAFKGCTGLTGSLVIPNSVKELYQSAFEGCSGFDGTLEIPNSVTEIMWNTFKGCSGFTGSLKIPNKVSLISMYAFEGCSGFDGTLEIPNSVRSIQQYAFSGCSGLTGTLEIPNSVRSIDSHAFSECSGFTGSLIIPNCVETIGTGAFKDCSGFNGSLIIPNSVTKIEASTFKGCSGFTGTLEIPNSVKSINTSAFSGCTGFTGALAIPVSVTSIGWRAFENCSGFDGSLVLHDSLTSIGDYAFQGCSGFIGTLDIPLSVESIGGQAFTGCDGIKDVKSMNRKVPNVGNQPFNSDVTIRVITGAGDDYRAATGWSSYSKLYEFGDANISKSLTVTDAVAVANNITGVENSSWDFLCADINFDESITISDATSIIDAVMTYNPSAMMLTRAMAPALTEGQLKVSDFTFDSMGKAESAVHFETAMNLVALQVDFVPTDGIVIEDVMLNHAVEATHSLTTARLNDGSIRVVIFSMGNDVIEPGDEPLMTLRLNDNGCVDGTVYMHNALASTRDAREMELSVSAGSNMTPADIENVTIASPEVRAYNGSVIIRGAQGSHVRICDISGRVINAFVAESELESRSLESGVYIVTIGDHSTKILL